MKRDQEQQPILLSRAVAAETISVSLRRLDELIKIGKIRSVRLGGRVLVPRDALVELAGNSSIQGTVEAL